MKNKYRTYNYYRNYKISEIHNHVLTSTRDNVDPAWLETAKFAALNGCSYTGFYGGNYCGAQGVTFLRPTNCAKGYYNVLKWIANENGSYYKKIKTHFGVWPAATIARLRDGKLIEKSDKLWVVTDLGIAYLEGAKKYLTNRTVK